MVSRLVPPRWLSEGAERLVDRIGRGEIPKVDIVVVGSGYGGAVAACRFAAMKKPNGQPVEVVLLERGDEYVPGALPDRFEQSLRCFRAERWPNGDRPAIEDCCVGLDQALLDFKLGGQVSALVGNGLGGGSLINANVVERPLPEVFSAPRWPSEVRSGLGTSMGIGWQYFDTVKQMLDANPWHGAEPAKRMALFDDTGALEKEVGRVAKVKPDIAVTQQAGENRHGVVQQQCIGCGNCVTGCNHWAKNTLSMNYLAMARRHGARLYTGATVATVHPVDSCANDTEWIVRLRLTHDRRDRDKRDTCFELRATRVILAAGTFGTAQILHQSLHSAAGRGALQHLDPATGGQLGRRFSCNGDSIAAAFDQKRVKAVNGVGKNPTFRADHPGDVGPTISGMIDLRRLPKGGFVIQDASIPFALERAYAEALTSFAAIHRMTGWNERSPSDIADPLAVDGSRTERTQCFLMVGHDDANWSLRFKRTSTQVGSDPTSLLSVVNVATRTGRDFEGVRRQEDRVHGVVSLMTQGHAKGTFIPNPLWQPAPAELIAALKPDSGGDEEGLDALGSQRLITVHPLGGCSMADAGSDGVVNHLGQVFRGGATSVFESLVVMDGSVIPSSLSINPLMTIAALAERSCEKLAEIWRLTAKTTTPGALPEQPALAEAQPWKETKSALIFREVMDGPLTLYVNKDVNVEKLTSNERAEALDARARLQVTFLEEDLWHLCQSPSHQVTTLPVRGQSTLTLFWKGGDPRANRPLTLISPASTGRRLAGGEGLTPIDLGSFPIRLLELLPSTKVGRIWRSLAHWWETRGKAFLYEQVPVAPLRSLAAVGIELLLSISSEGARRLVVWLMDHTATIVPGGKLFKAMLRIASHHGEARGLTYDLPSLAPADTPFGSEVRVLAAKRLHYGMSPGYLQRPSKGVVDPCLPAKVPSNPWRAAIELDVLLVSQTEGRALEDGDWPFDQRPDWLQQSGWCVVAKGKWSLLLRHLIQDSVPQWVEYTTLPDAWLDAASFAAFSARSLGQIYFWRFRLPAYPKRLPTAGGAELGPLPAQRLVGDHYEDAPGEGKVWKRYELTGGGLLTRFYPGEGTVPRRFPVILIHGFVTSGYQFATPRLRTNAVQWLTSHGFDVWVLDLRTSVARPRSHEQWDFDQVAAEDVPQAWEAVLTATGAEQAHAVVHCMGSAVFNMAVLSGRLQRGKKSLVRSAVQCQVSMDVVSSPPNRLKAAGVEMLKDVFDARELNVVADDRTVTAERILETLLDRLLMTWPTNDRQALFQMDNELHAPRQTFVATVNRINAMYGRNFSYQCLSADMLAHLHEVFRHANVTTMRHVMRFHRAGRVVDRDGRDIYVTDVNIKDNYGFPVCFLHGQQAAVFDQSSTRRSLIRLQRLHGGIEHTRKLLRRTRSESDDCAVAQWGHFDIWLSEDSAEKVFPPISEFLVHHDVQESVPDAPPASRCVYRVPSLGPRLGWWRLGADGQPWARVWFRTPFASETPIDVQPWWVPINGLGARPIAGWTSMKRLESGCGVLDVTLQEDMTDGDLCMMCRSDQQFWFHESDPSARPSGDQLWWTPLEEADLSHPMANGADAHKVAVALASPDSRARLAGDSPLGAESQFFEGETPPGIDISSLMGPGTPDLALDFGDAHDDGKALGALLEALRRKAPGIRITPALIESLSEKDGVGLVLASCRYQATGMEQFLADRNTSAWAARADIALVCGDQIYADATYGVLDGRASFDRIKDKYTALFAGGLGALGCRLPLYLCGDDHELRDDWNRELRGTADQMQRDQMAMSMMDAYQYLAMPQRARCESGMTSRCYHFASSGFLFFVLDARFERGAPGTSLWNACQRETFSNWLKVAARRPDSRPVFIVSSVPFLPLLKGWDEPEELLRGDQWPSYPQSVCELLDALFESSVRRVVFLSGDRHLSHWVRGSITKSGATVEFDSIVSSGLNAPMPFANERPENILTSVYLEFPKGSGYLVKYDLMPGATTVDGAAFVRVERLGGSWGVGAEFS